MQARLMGRADPPHRPLLATMTTVHREVEDFWQSHWPSADVPKPGAPLSVLDAYLFHLVLDLMPAPPVLIDLAAESTSGATSLIGLAHPRVNRVMTQCSGLSAAANALGSYSRQTREIPLEIVEKATPIGLANRRVPVVVVMDAREPEIAQTLREWLENGPQTLAILLGLGKLGQCPALGMLSSPDPDREFGLIRELGEVLAASSMGIVARREANLTTGVMDRLQGLFAGRFGVLDLLRTVNHSAIRAAGIDADAMRSHVWSWALTSEMDRARDAASVAKKEAAEEIERLLRTIWDSRQETAAAIRSLEEARREVEALRAQFAGSPLRRARRLVGRLARAIKAG